jgi:nitroreductase
MDFFAVNNKRRTVRCFKQIKVKKAAIKKMLDAARKCSSAGNMQQLRYIVVSSKELVNKIFTHTAWGGLVKPMRNPEIGKSAPLVFIAVIAPQHEEYIIHADAGATIQTMQLAAAAQQLGCCWLGAFNRSEVNKILEINNSSNVLYLLAVGYPDETPIMENINGAGSVKYYLDKANRLHVPKLTVDAITEWR